MIRAFSIIIFLIPISLASQQDSYLSLFSYNMLFVNPAFAGAEGKHVISLTSRNQWNDTEKSPKTTAISYSVESGKNVGLGISVLSDKIFIENQTTISADFSYRLTLNSKSTVLLGIKASGNSYSSDPSLLRGYNSEVDPLKNSFSSFNPNLGIGILYKSSKLWFSASVPRLFNSKRNGEDLVIQSRDRVHVYLAGEANLSLNDRLSVKPTFIFRQTKGINSVTDIGIKVGYLSFFELGFSIRTGSIFSSQAIININENFSLGYAYDTFSNDKLSGLNLKAHEIAIRFKFGGKPDKSEVEEPLPE
ncbi:MAG: hypothetical protein CMC22_02030 [Flavobacteriaceae bacterium]|nr:hypothetical protein [Flavobacteriaceae bacterium]